MRLQLLKQQAAAGDAVLLFADESEALTHPYLAHAWAPRGADLRIAAPGQAEKVALLGVLESAGHELLVQTAPHKRSAEFVALLQAIDRRGGPAPGSTAPAKPVVLMLDNGPIHTSKRTTAALSSRPWLRIEWLPKYAPELNDLEGCWRNLKRHYLAHRTFRDADHLETSIHDAVDQFNLERANHSCDSLRIAA